MIVENNITARAEAEVDLAKRLEAGRTADEMLMSENLAADEKTKLEQISQMGQIALNRLVESNIGLVHSFSNQYRQTAGLAYEDLVQEATIGLIQAVERFDYTKGYKFSSFAEKHIKRGLIEGWRATTETIKLPREVRQKLSQIRRARGELMMELGSDASFQQIAERTGLTADEVVNLLAAGNINSLDAPVGGEEDSIPLAEKVADESSHSAERVVNSLLTRAGLRQTIAEVLDKREAAIIHRRFGLDDQVPDTHEVIAADLGISINLVSRLEHRAIYKLSSVDYLKDFFADVA